ncbi:hypothetical protein COU77_02025 [Candidatus Peregrinibacteria bacterium CG10_big_fil_rev_8_21_14_0_10_49_16]|nr:MAG: hypothetical protein COW95_03180 [Candidatus Peregrinibacteria bacterium CG22_combo_CG10-13_8_21_14_all_49_11]PIR52130.1 MAG: hypothetical protein COU77_02025 [Candidatus Peregrinibacteria bacterium CG10_big_fil_rev_8_21_14_0_10_49_16]
MITLLSISTGLIVLAVVVRFLRPRLDAVARKLTRALPSVCTAFGLVGCVLVVSRVEGVQYLSMRFLWVIWFLLLGLFVVFQWKIYRQGHYRIERTSVEVSLRDKYLPARKHKL